VETDIQNLDLALIGNSTIAALIDRNASIVWGCFPRFDGDALFCELLRPAGKKTTSAFSRSTFPTTSAASSATTPTRPSS